MSDKRAIAVTRKFLPWPSFLNYENDDDFFSWYSGESVPSPEEIAARELEVIEMRLSQQANVEDNNISCIRLVSRK